MAIDPKRQANINARKFDQLMKDIEKDVGRRTINAKNTDDWMNKLGIYVNRNPFTPGGAKHDEAVQILNDIMGQAKFKGLARGGTQELVKGVISENTMHYVTRMGDDMKNNLRRIFVESYNNKLAPREIAKKLQKEVQGLSKTRAMAIARTETMRTSNLSNYVNAKLNMGAKSYHVRSDKDCCDKCSKIYNHGEVWFDIDDLTYFPPLHPNCRCVAAYSTKTADKNNGVEDEDLAKKPQISQETIAIDGKTEEYKLYDYSKDKIKIYEGMNVNKSHINEVKAHYDNLPQKMKDNVSEIVLVNRSHNSAWVDSQEIAQGMRRIYVPPKNFNSNNYFNHQETYFDAINHEIMHLLDNTPSNSWRFSNDQSYKDAFDKDRDIYLKKSLNGETTYDLKKTFSSEYAYNSYFNYPTRPYSEDLSESVMYYLNPNTKQQFIERYPNKSKELEKIIY